MSGHLGDGKAMDASGGVAEEGADGTRETLLTIITVVVAPGDPPGGTGPRRRREDRLHRPQIPPEARSAQHARDRARECREDAPEKSLPRPSDRRNDHRPGQ